MDLGAFAIQGIAKGFFSKLGGDIYEVLKSKLKKVSEKKTLKNSEYLLQFQLFIKSYQGRTVEVNLVITNPSLKDIDGFFEYSPKILNTTLKSLPIDQSDLCKLVFEYKFTQLKLLYALRSDGVPLTLTYSDKSEDDDAPLQAYGIAIIV